MVEPSCIVEQIISLMNQYMMWRVLTGLHKEVTLSFMLAGHTKFSPDWCFGLVKQKLRKTRIGSLAEIAAAVEESATPNLAQLAGAEDGTPIVTTYDWSGYLGPHFKKIPGIKKLHHFNVSYDSPGHVILKEYNDSEGVKFKLLKDDWSPSATDLPPVVTPPGLSPERQWYLFDSIRVYCPPYCRDTVCPLPRVPRPGNTSEQDTITSVTPQPTSATTTSPAAKRPRLCSICGETGHNARKHK